MNIAKTRTRDRILDDMVRESPVDEWLLRTRRILILLPLVILLIIAVLLLRRFTADDPVTSKEPSAPKS